MAARDPAGRAAQSLRLRAAGAEGSLKPIASCDQYSCSPASLSRKSRQAAAPADEKPAPIVCPVRGGGYDDRYAVAQLLILQKNIPQAEACLLEAVQV